MSEHINAVLFDMGGTLRRTIRRSPAEKLRFVKQVMELINSTASPEEFAELLSARARAYRRWAQKNLIELNESDLWTKWMLPNFPAEKIEALALKLNHLWREATGKRVVFPETQETVLALYRRGYRLGLVSNTTSSVEAPRLLEDLKLAGCFEVVILSCEVGERKPSPGLLLKAIDRMGIRPEQCAYIGDRPNRDVAAARGAGFARTVILRDPRKPTTSPADPALMPDHFIGNLKELLDIFPALRTNKHPSSDEPVYDASLSTMWGIKKFAAFSDFLIASRRLGFAYIELNHQVAPTMLAGFDRKNGYRVSSVHEPCPAVISAEILKKQDLLISSPVEERRLEGVNSIKRSIDLAHELGAGTVVVHCGQIQADGLQENELRDLFECGLVGSPEYQEKKERFEKLRASLVGPCLQALRKSLPELLEHAGKLNIRLGLENRYHILDIPNVDEMGELLNLAGPDRLGFLYDFGHARALDRLGFYPNEHWLQRYGNRIIGVHIHDVVGVTDHRAPGLGELDFRCLASWLPKDAFRTLELQGHNSPEQIKNALKILVDSGCINRID
jgi:HAD superfamily hydrolase (TIGR01662 family)